VESDETCIPPARDTEAPARDVSAVTVAGTLEWEATSTGTFGGSETEYDGRRVQAWELDAEAGTRVVIEMRSDDFDSYLYLTGPGYAEPAFNDDGAGNLNARICAELPESGRYLVLSGAFSGGDAGQIYTVRPSRVDAPSACDEFEMTPEAVTGALAQMPTDGRTLRLGAEATSELDSITAGRHPDTNRPLQAWSFQGQADRTVYVDVVSDDFDTVLYAMGAGLDGILFIDDGEAGCNSRMAITPTQNGEIRLFPGGYREDASGAYRLRASESLVPLEDNGCDFEATAVVATSAFDGSLLAGISSGEDRRVEPVTVARGSLGSEDERLGTGQPAQAWTLPVTSLEEVEITLVSEAFDPVLYVDGAPVSAPLTDDDSAGELDSRITLTAVTNGLLRIVVSAYASDAAGDFELRIVRRSP
jgi:hypothetical protein